MTPRGTFRSQHDHMHTNDVLNQWAQTIYTALWDSPLSLSFLQTKLTSMKVVCYGCYCVSLYLLIRLSDSQAHQPRLATQSSILKRWRDVRRKRSLNETQHQHLPRFFHPRVRFWSYRTRRYNNANSISRYLSHNTPLGSAFRSWSIPRNLNRFFHFDH